MHRDLRSFLDTLRREGELVEIDAPVDPKLELAEIHRRVIAAGGPALLFKRPTSDGRTYDIPVVTNLFGTPKRVDLAFGKRPADFVRRAVRLATKELMPPTLGKLWNNRDLLMQGARIGMKRSSTGPVTEVLRRPPELDRIPMLTSWPEDGGAFVTLPLVYTEHPEEGGHNLGMYRIQRYDDRTAGFHVQIGKGAGYHLHEAHKRGEALPVTVLVGGPPALIVSAIAPLPENVPELLLASLLVGERLRTCDGPLGHPHPLVADCEFAILGRVRADDTRPEGPFGDHYGYYSLQHDYPVLRVDAVAHRKDPIWPATVVGKPRQEDLYIGDYLQELLSPLFPVVMPNVKDLWSYGETGYHALAGAVVEERYRREAMSAAFRILGEGQLSLTKFLWVVDARLDLKDPKAVLTHLLARFRPETDLYVFSNVSMDTLDYSGPELNLGSKGVMLGVGEPWRELPKAFSGPLPPGATEVAVFCPGVLVVSGPSFGSDPNWAATLPKALPDWPLVVAAEDARRVAGSDARFLWATFTRFEPAGDLHASGTRVARHHLVYEGTIAIDARMKPTYPKELFCDPDTAATVGRRWSEYFPGGKVEMGDSDQGHLG